MAGTCLLTYNLGTLGVAANVGFTLHPKGRLKPERVRVKLPILKLAGSIPATSRIMARFVDHHPKNSLNSCYDSHPATCGNDRSLSTIHIGMRSVTNSLELASAAAIY